MNSQTNYTNHRVAACHLTICPTGTMLAPSLRPSFQSTQMCFPSVVTWDQLTVTEGHPATHFNQVVWSCIHVPLLRSGQAVDTKPLCKFQSLRCTLQLKCIDPCRQIRHGCHWWWQRWHRCRSSCCFTRRQGCGRGEPEAWWHLRQCWLCSQEGTHPSLVLFP